MMNFKYCKRTWCILMVLTVVQCGLPTNSMSQNQSTHDAVLDRSEYDALKVGAMQKVKELEKYIVSLTSKETDNVIKEKTVDLAVKLFESEEKVVEVASKNNPDIKQFPIRQYLNRLRILPYDRVEIKWYDISYVSDFVRDAEGNYRGVITIFQAFKGVRISPEGNEEIVYEDTEKKDIEIMIKQQERYYGDRKVEEREIMLGNIRVQEFR